MWKLIDSRCCCHISSVIPIVSIDLGGNLFNTRMTIELFYLMALTDKQVH